MFWLTRPPYLRWALAGLVLIVGVTLELRPPRTTPHPFAIETIGVGEQIDETRVRWRDVPTDLLAPVDLPVTAMRRIEAGDPVLAGTGAGNDDGAIPAGWWAIELDMPAGARAGMPVRVVTHDGTADGVVIEVRDGDFGVRSGLVAVPDELAHTVATALLDSSVAVLLGG